MKSQEYSYNYTQLTNGEKYPQKGTAWLFPRRRRMLVAWFAFFGFFNIYALRVNLSVAIVAMTDPVETTLGNGTLAYLPQFNWDSQTKGLLLSSFFYGYILTQLPGSWLADKIGGNRIFGLGIGATSLFTLLTPPLARTSTSLLVAVRVIEGLFEGVTYPSIHAVWSRWAPGGERARLASLAFSGSYAGSVVSMPLSSMLATYAGWSGIFYVFGIIGLIWTALWWMMVKEWKRKVSEMDPHITSIELKYIQNTRGTSMKVTSELGHPWGAMLTSAPVWAIVVAHFSENWGFYTLMTFLPTFMKDVYKFDMNSTGWLSAIPYLAMALVLQVAGYSADVLLTKGTLSRTNIRRVFTCGAFLSQAVFMTAAASAESAMACVVFLTMGVGLGGFAWAGFSVNHLDIAPRHASALMAVSNTFATLPGVVGPALAGAVVVDKTAAQWRTVFFISSTIYVFGAIVYGIFCSAEKQKWVADCDNNMDLISS